MFDQTFVDARAKTRRPWTVAVSLVLQTGLVAIAFLAPLVRVAVIERPENVSALLPPQLPGDPPEPETKPWLAQCPPPGLCFVRWDCKLPRPYPGTSI